MARFIEEWRQLEGTLQLTGTFRIDENVNGNIIGEGQVQRLDTEHPPRNLVTVGVPDHRVFSRDL